MYRLTSTALAVVVSLAAIDIASAQTTPSSPPSTPSKSTDKSPPMPGANSFTAAQAKARMEKAGFTQVKSLKKDAEGIWRASAMQSGKQVNISLDFKGNVVAN